MSEKISELEYRDINVGEKATFTVTIDAKMVEDFAKMSGDNNPLHTDDSYASQTEFGSRVAHGMIVGALFSKLVGIHLPGKYCLYLSQNIKFHKPILIGTDITIEGVVEQKLDALNVIKIKTTAYNAQNNDVLVQGEAMVKLMK